MTEGRGFRLDNEVEARAYLQGSLGVLEDVIDLVETIAERAQQVLSDLRTTLEGAPKMMEKFVATLPEDKRVAPIGEPEK